MADEDAVLKADWERLARIPFLPVLLDVVCSATGMGFAAVARVTEDRWIAGAVRDDIQFGLAPGGELPIASTICQEIRRSKVPVIIDHVSHNAQYCDHHTPLLYGFESYISFPIIRKDGSVYGTLCAIDPHTSKLNTPSVIQLFTILADLIAAYLDGLATLAASNISKLEMYIAAELRNAQNDLEPHSAAGSADQKTRQLSGKIDLLIMALDPQGAFLS